MSAKRYELFEFVIMLHPTEEEWEKGGRTTRVDPDGQSNFLAPDLETARLMAASRIPKHTHDKIDRVEVAVRPFRRASD